MFRYFQGHPRLRNTLLFLICVLAAFAMRTHNYNREARSIAAIIQDQPAVRQNFFEQFFPVVHHNFMPYTIECAMMFGYTQDIAADRGVPKSDKNLHGLEDIAPYRQMIMGLEWFLGWGYRIKSLLFPDPQPSPLEKRFQDNVYLAQWAALQLRFWISLSSGFIFLLLIVLRCRTSLAFFGGMFHAVAISAIARSTGQDMIRGNFALPIISGFLLLLYSCYTRGARWMYALLFLAAFTAFSTWDLCLGFFSALTCFELGRWLFGGRVSRRRRNAWLVIASAVVLSSLLVPFNQTYQTIMSPLVVVLLPLALFIMFGRQDRHRVFWKRLLMLVLPGICLWLIWNFAVKTPHYVSHYSHFSDLTAAKLKFNNVKPPNPDKLTYDARMMWTPAMHSADWEILITYFPSIGVLTGARFIFRKLNNLIIYTPFSWLLFYLLLLAAPFSLIPAGMVKRNLPRSLFPFTFTVVFTVGFIYIVRYHEFLILFLALALPLLLDDWFRALKISRKATPASDVRHRRGLKVFKAVLVCSCVLLIVLESVISLCGRRNYSRDVRLRETAGLIAWFRQENPAGKGVITDFGLGPMLKCYAGMGIALQPQFGLARIRKPVQIYLNLLYHGNERQLAEFCSGLNADFLVYNHGCVGPLHIYSDRYIAGARKIKPDSPANLMRYRPDVLRWFYRIDPPREYRSINGVYSVFRVIRPLDRLKAVTLCQEAARLYKTGRRTTAMRMISSAFLLDPASEQIRTQYFSMTGHIPELGLNGIRK